MVLYPILIRSPVNKLASIVTSQRGVAKEDDLLSKEKLVYIMERLLRKQRLLKLVLGIHNKTHMKNIKYKFNKGGKARYKLKILQKEPRAFLEFKRCGEQINLINLELAALRKLNHKNRTKLNAATITTE